MEERKKKKMGSFKMGLKNGPWTAEEDHNVVSYIQKHGLGNWQDLPKLAGLNRSGRSCRLRWINYLLPRILIPTFSQEEERRILSLHSILGDRWSEIASHLPGRTDYEIKNFWNNHLKEKLIQSGFDPVTHQPFVRGRTDKNEIQNFNNFGKGKGFLSQAPIQGESHGNRTNFESIKVAKGATPSFQETEETTPNSEVEGSPFSSSFQPNSAQASVYECAESEYDDYFPDWLDWGNPDFFWTLENRYRDVRSQTFQPSLSSTQPDTLGNVTKPGHGKMGELSANSLGEQESGSHLLVLEELQGNMMNFNSIKVAEGTTPYFQEIEETTHNSEIEGSQSSSFHPNIYRVPSLTIDTASPNSAQASAYEDAETDSPLSWVSSTSMLSPNWVSEYEDYLPDWVDRGDSGFLGSLLEHTYEEVASQPFHPSLSSTQLDTMVNTPEQGHEKLGELSANSFGEQEFGTHPPVRGELQAWSETTFVESEDDSSRLSDSAHDLISRSHEQEDACDDLLHSLQPFHEHSKKLLSPSSVGEWEEFGSHLLIQGELQGTISTQSVDAASETVMDYTSEFTRSEVFGSKEELIEWIREVGRKNGFMIVIKRSDSGDGGQKARITFCCERGGQCRNIGKNKVDRKEKQSRNTSTKKCGCPFTLKGQKLDNKDNWKLKVVCGVHNHPTSEPLKRYSYAGRLSKEETLLLIDMSKSSARPKDILVTLQNRNANNASTTKQIYNARQRYKKVIEMPERLWMQKLLCKLSEYNYIEWHRSFDNPSTIKDLFWAHPVSIDLLHAFPCVLLMDCTHKTSGNNRTLLEIVGVTSTKRKFSVAFAYLESEQEDNYTWALERLRSIMDDNAPTVILSDKELALMAAFKRVFPNTKHLLCRRHINKNVWTNCKNLFATNEIWETFRMSWKLVVLSSNEDEFAKHLNTLKQDFGSYPQAIEYVTKTWLNYYKERFVSAWTDKIMHFGNLKKERVKSLHSRMKKLLHSNQNKFETSWEELHKLLEQQHGNIKASFEKSLALMNDPFEHVEFKELRGFISIDALQMVLSELERANFTGVDASKCGCVIRRTHGLPCAHEIAKFKIESLPIPLESIDLYWTKLNLIPATKKQEAKLGYEPVSELIAKCFDETYDDTKSVIAKKLNGRLDSKGLSKISTAQVKKNRQSKGKVYGNKRLKLNAFVSFFPVGLQPYIHQIKDVAADGNCGFRAIADLMGFGENEWQRVREDLLYELNSNLEHYSLIYGNGIDGTDGRVKELIHSLSYFDNCPSRDGWMIMPDMGHLIASAYNIVLFHLSLQQCLTLFPLRSVPMPTDSRKDIAIGFVNKNHFVEVFLLPDHPVPPIASNWYKFHHSSAEGWDTMYISRMQYFKMIVGHDVATNEIVIDSNSDDL